MIPAMAPITVVTRKIATKATTARPISFRRTEDDDWLLMGAI